MDILETVLRAGEADLEPSEEAPFPDLLRSSLGKSELYHEGSLLLDEMRDLHGVELFQRLARLASMWAAWGRSEPLYGPMYRNPQLVAIELFARGAEYLQDSSEGSRQSLLRFTEQMLGNLFLILYGQQAATSLLEEIWGEEAVSLLASISHVQEATSRRWIKEGKVLLDSFPRRILIESSYHMLSSGWQREDIKVWWKDHLHLLQQQPLRQEELLQLLRSEGFEAWSWLGA